MRRSKEDIHKDQYSSASVAAYEAIYGADFVSPGGREMARRFVQRLGLTPGQTVLDVGSGLGGCAFLMAQEFEVNVVGVDAASSMVLEARQRCGQKGLAQLVDFREQDCLELTDSATYEAVVSRDVFLHIHRKEQLFERLYTALKPGGRLLFTDYCCREKPWPWGFAAYVEARGYCLHTLPEYVGLIQGAGFTQVEATDITDLFVETLNSELKRVGTSKELGWTSRTGLALAWRTKLKRARSGVHRWGLFEATKS